MAETFAVQIIEELVEALSQIAPNHSSLKIARAYLRQVALPPEREEQVFVLPRWVKKKPCYTCGADIFFAGRHDYKGEIRWTTIHPQPVVMDAPLVDAVSLLFDSVASAAMIMPTEAGVQWFPHRIFCGIDERPDDPLLADVWDLTTGKDQVAEEKALEVFKKVLEGTE